MVAGAADRIHVHHVAPTDDYDNYSQRGFDNNNRPVLTSGEVSCRYHNKGVYRGNCNDGVGTVLLITFNLCEVISALAAKSTKKMEEDEHMHSI